MSKPRTEYPCPRCLENDVIAVVGNRRWACPVCNNFARKLERRVIAKLKEAHPRSYRQLTKKARAELYDQLLESLLEMEDTAK